jgi:hypothetical protein
MKTTDQLQHSLILQGLYGTRYAATYLRSRGWSLEAALWTLLNTEIRCSDYDFDQEIPS